MAKQTATMVQAELSRPLSGGGRTTLTTWIEKKYGVLVGGQITLQGDPDRWNIVALGIERPYSELQAQEEAQRDLADKLGGC